MDKTVTVQVARRLRHPLYGKFVTKSKKYHAHDEQNECQMGDTVTVAESRPLSKSKSWTLVKIEEQAVKV
jgi:small subunit ribosomal protein S17